MERPTGFGLPAVGAAEGGEQAEVCSPSGVLFDVKRYAIHDGPGIRTTAFLKGCPLDCPWCHNPEGKQPNPELSFLAHRCLACGLCASACPRGAITISPGELPNTDRGRCTACGACVEICPAGARAVVGTTYSVRELVAQLERDRIFYEQSGGGVTFSGGEPLAQPDFLLACLAACRRRGLHTALDTCGYSSRPALLAAARLADLVLYDIKHMDPERHLAATGVPLKPILTNLVTLAEEEIPVWIRIPLIPGFNDDRETVEGYVAFLSRLGQNCPVDLLPYHRIGRDKYRRLGLPYTMDGVAPPARERADELAQRLAAAGLEVRIGG
ncbi:MAG: glycyl-radical enzyme activating protein [Candidatus Bipolaricaulaceae bacterium]